MIPIIRRDVREACQGRLAMVLVEWGVSSRTRTESETGGEQINLKNPPPASEPDSAGSVAASDNPHRIAAWLSEADREPAQIRMAFGTVSASAGAAALAALDAAKTSDILPLLPTEQAAELLTRLEPA